MTCVPSREKGATRLVGLRKSAQRNDRNTYPSQISAIPTPNSRQSASCIWLPNVAQSKWMRSRNAKTPAAMARTSRIQGRFFFKRGSPGERGCGDRIRLCARTQTASPSLLGGYPGAAIVAVSALAVRIQALEDLPDGGSELA